MRYGPKLAATKRGADSLMAMGTDDANDRLPRGSQADASRSPRAASEVVRVDRRGRWSEASVFVVGVVDSAEFDSAISCELSEDRKRWHDGPGGDE
jgi:hypothetical protein